MVSPHRRWQVSQVEGSFPDAQPRGAWAPAPARPVLPAGELHIWRVPLADSPDALSEAPGLLSADELQRAGRFVFARDRERFVAARSRLRRILGAYLEVAPHKLRFAYGAQGKPELDGSCAQSGLSFNLSHSDDLALCAVVCKRRVGVDVELVRHTLDYVPLLHDLFAPRERQAFSGLPEGEGRLRFFRSWVCKEAYIKALGEGLAHSPAAVEVDFSPGAPATLRFPAEAPPWSLYLIDPGGGYVAAAVVEGGPLAARLFDHPWLP